MTIKKILTALTLLFLITTLFVGAVSATTNIVLFPYTNVTAQDSDLNPDDRLVSLSDPSNSIVLISNGNGGAYFTGNNLIQGTYTKDHTKDYDVYYPDAEIKITVVGLNDDMNGETVPKSCGLKFTVTPLINGYYPESLWFTTPSGGQMAIIGSKNSAQDYSVNPSFIVDTLDDYGVEQGLWKVQAKMKSSDFMSGAPLSSGKEYRFTVATIYNSFNLDKDTIIRGRSFLATVAGTPTDTVDIIINSEGLYLHEGQSVVDYESSEKWSGSDSYKKVSVVIPSSGQATIQFDTKIDTNPQTYRLIAEFSQTDKQAVDVNVNRGAVTLTSDANSYYIGNKISLSGTNTETGEIYLYIKGSSKAIQEIPTDTGGYATPKTSPVRVDSDNTWTKSFTLANEFDTGTYIIYAAANKFAYAKKSDDTDNEPYVVIDENVEYATKAITLKDPFLLAKKESDSIAKGDNIKITGIAEGTPGKLSYYVFGTNKFLQGLITPNDDATYEVEIPTNDLSSGQYFVVIQHPMYDKLFNVQVVSENYKYIAKSYESILDKTLNPTAKKTSEINTVQPDVSSLSVCDLIDEEYVNDIYVKFDFVVSGAYITINPISNQKKGATFTVSGTTDVAVGKDVIIEVISTKFLSEPKASIPESSYLAQTAKVVAGSNSVNTYSATFDGTQLEEDNYIAVATITRESDIRKSTAFSIGSAPKPTPTEFEQVVISNSGMRIVSSLVTPEYTNSIADNTEVTYETIIRIPSGSMSSLSTLRLITNLNSPVFKIDYYKKDAPLLESYGYGSVYEISGWSLSYEDSLDLKITTTGTYSKSMGEILLFEASVSDSPELSYKKTYGQIRNDVHLTDDSINILSGWNFISIPQTLDSSENTASKVFEGIDTDGKSILGYNAQTKTWEALKENTQIKPLTGYWIYSKTDDSIELTYTSDPATPPAKSVYEGWNAVGLSENEATPAQNALAGTEWVKVRQWNIENKNYDTAITKISSPDQLIQLKNGYWLYVESDGTLV